MKFGRFGCLFFIRFHTTTVSLFIKLGVWSVIGLSQILDFMEIHMDSLYVYEISRGSPQGYVMACMLM